MKLKHPSQCSSLLCGFMVLLWTLHKFSDSEFQWPMKKTLSRGALKSQTLSKRTVEILLVSGCGQLIDSLLCWHWMEGFWCFSHWYSDVTYDFLHFIYYRPRFIMPDILILNYTPGCAWRRTYWGFTHHSPLTFQEVCGGRYVCRM